VVAPRNLDKLSGLIRERAATILDSLPRNEEFNWVDLVSIELTTQMLATLFDFPFEDRRKLTRWSDVATANEESGIIDSEDQRRAELLECLEYFTGLWNERINKDPGEDMDLISMLAHGESTKNMQPMEYLGNLILLIVGGNDTTRNSISGGVLALNQSPDQYQKLRDDPSPSLAASRSRPATRWRCGMCRVIGTRMSSTGPTTSSLTAKKHASTCLLATAYTVAWAIALPRCSCASCGKRSCSVSTPLSWWATRCGSDRVLSKATLNFP
jgi:hypothetical protein